MMFSNFESGYPVHDDDNTDSSNGQLLHDIEEISKALYLDHKTHQTSLLSSSNLMSKSVKKSHFSDCKSKPEMGFDDEDEWLYEEKKASSIWGWKPFKALSHIRNRKFICFFFCHVHCIDNLPSDFDGISLSVLWKRKDSLLKTLPLKVSNGVVEFEETLMSKCTVYCAKTGAGNFVKYEPKHFLLYASVAEAGGLDIGKHWVDLTRLLPLTIEELEEDKCSGKWSTSFKLAGKAKGATLHVSFAFLVTKASLTELNSNVNLPLVFNLEQDGLNRMSFVADVGHGKGNAMLRRAGSVPSRFTSGSSDISQCPDVKFGWSKDMSDFSNSINMLYGKLEEGIVDCPAKVDIVFEQLESLKLTPNSGKDFSKAEDDHEFTVIEKGIELERSPQDEGGLDSAAGVEALDVSTVEVIDVAEIFKDGVMSSDEETKSNEKDEVSGCAENDALIDKHSVLETLEPNTENELLELEKMFMSESADFEYSVDEISNPVQFDQKGSKLGKSYSLDDISKAVADDFFNLLRETYTPSNLSSNGDLESPRERLLREFEDDLLNTGSLFLDVDVQEDKVDSDCGVPSESFQDYNVEGLNLLPVIDTAGKKSEKQSSKSKMKAELLERLETESLMQRWGLNEEAFQNPLHYSSGGFGSPVFVPAEEPVGLPPLGEGLGSLLELKDGGLLRSMSPLLFRNAKNCGNLTLQASKPVVLPAELGSDVTEILQCMASVGVERLSQKLHKLMPLEELSGRIIQQLAWEASCNEEVLERPASSQHASHVETEVEGTSHYPGYTCPNSSLTHMDPEYVSIKDLAPLALDSIEALMIEGLRIQSGMSDNEAPSSVRVKSVGEAASQNRIVCMDEFADFLGIEPTANHIEQLLDLSISLDEWLRLDAGTFVDKDQVNDHTMRLLTAHHANSSYISNGESATEDNTLYESVNFGVLGDSLTVALMTQLRDPLRNFEPVGGPMLGLIQVDRVSSSDSEDRIRPTGELNGRQENIPRFRVNEVHVAGLYRESGIPEIWAPRRQQQSGSRWLLASGMTKSRASNCSKSMSMTLSTRILRNTWTQNLLWSISRHANGVNCGPLESLTLRNPDVIFPEKVLWNT